MYKASSVNRLSYEEYARVWEFCVSIRAKYEKKGSRDYYNGDYSEKRLINDLVGKIGEYAVSYRLGGECDFRVWYKGERGLDYFEADVVNNKYLSRYKIHVKTTHLKYMSSVLAYYRKKRVSVIEAIGNTGNRLSWTIDKNDPLMKNPRGEDVIVLAAASEYGDYVIVGCLYAREAYAHWKPCITLGHKRAIYSHDIIEYVVSLEDAIAMDIN